MTRSRWLPIPLAVAAIALLSLPGPAAAKTDAAKSPGVLRCAHTYAEAMAEAKDRGCVVFATFHSDG